MLRVKDDIFIRHFLSLLGDFEFEGTFLEICRKRKDSLLTRKHPSVVMRFGERCLQSGRFWPKKWKNDNKK